MKKWWKDRFAMVPFLGLCLFLPGVHAAVCTTLGIRMSYWKMTGIYSLVSLFLILLVCLPKRWLWKAVFLLGVFFGAFLRENWQRLSEHTGVLGYYINKRNKAYTGRGLFPDEWCSRGELTYNIALILFCIFIGLYIAWVTWNLQSKLLVSAPVVLIYCGALMLGVAPGQLATLFLVAGMALEMLWISERQRMRSSVRLKEQPIQIGSVKRICILVVILVAVLSVSWHLTARMSGRVFRHVNRLQIKQRNMEEELQNIVEKKGQELRGWLGLDSGGHLSNTSPKYLNKMVLEVSVREKPKNNLYLRGFVGDKYQNGKWKASHEIQKENGRRRKGIWEGKYNDSSYDEFVSEECDIKIRYTSFGKRSMYLYTPYSENSGANGINDKEMGLCLGEADDELKLYQELAGQMEDGSIRSSNYLVMETQNILWGNADYSLELDPVPRNQDYAEYFLFYSQKGYCEHFATAGTLLLRHRKQIARYVSGYRIPQNRFTENINGTYTAVVLDSDAHAWSEVWVKGSYWMPQEMTPVDDDSQESAGTRYIADGDFSEDLDVDILEPTEQPVSRPTEEPLETEEPEETERPSADPKSEMQKSGLPGGEKSGANDGSVRRGGLQQWWQGLARWQKTLLKFVGAVILLSVMIGCYLYGRIRKRLQRMAQLRERNKNGYIRLRLGLFLDRLHHSGVAVRIGMPEQQWLQILSETLQEQKDPADLEKVAELVRRAAYSKETVTGAEVNWFDAYCSRIEGRLAEKSPHFIVSIFKDRIGKTAQK